MGIFPDAQGQPTPKSYVGSGQNSNLFKLLWLSSLPARIKKIHSKMNVLEWSQHYTSILKTLNEILWLYLLPAKMKKIQSKMEELV